MFGVGGRGMPGVREKPLHLRSTTDLWAPIIFAPVFGSCIVAMPLTLGTLSWWGTLVLLLFGGSFALPAVLSAVSGLKELRRRSAWVPPGVARQPVLGPIVLWLLTRPVGVAYPLPRFRARERRLARCR